MVDIKKEKIVKMIISYKGTLHEGDIVTIDMDNYNGGKYKTIDMIGNIWYLDEDEFEFLDD